MNNILLDEDHWKIIKRDGLDLVKLKCAKCGVWGDLEDHAIDKDGIINPSVICGNDSCDWHVMAALKNFKRPEEKCQHDKGLNWINEKARGGPIRYIKAFQSVCPWCKPVDREGR